MLGSGSLFNSTYSIAGAYGSVAFAGGASTPGFAGGGGGGASGAGGDASTGQGGGAGGPGVAISITGTTQFFGGGGGGGCDACPSGTGMTCMSCAGGVGGAGGGGNGASLVFGSSMIANGSAGLPNSGGGGGGGGGNFGSGGTGGSGVVILRYIASSLPTFSVVPPASTSLIPWRLLIPRNYTLCYSVAGASQFVASGPTLTLVGGGGLSTGFDDTSGSTAVEGSLDLNWVVRGPNESSFSRARVLIGFSGWIANSKSVSCLASL